jgi:hypothetical protein
MIKAVPLARGAAYGAAAAAFGSQAAKELTMARP